MMVPRSTEPVSIHGSGVKVAFGAGNLKYLGKIARELGAKRVLLVSDPGIVAAGHCERAMRSLRDSAIETNLFSDFGENPTTEDVAACVEFASTRDINFIVGLGGGSSVDCAKGTNFILTNGGRIQDYWGVNLARKPLLPLIAVPTTAGTGSDGQSFALITDPETHQKMACGDRSALPEVSILDPELTATQPAEVAAAAGIDAITHAVESSATKRKTSVSVGFSKAAWELLESSYETAMRDPSDQVAREKMLLGSHLAGVAIENSMLGAAHSLANALTAVQGIVHGVAVGMMMPHVVRFNSQNGVNPYSDLDPDAENLARRIDQLVAAGNIPRRLGECGVTSGIVPQLSAIAARQWTAQFNPRPVGEPEFRQILQKAL
jgi:alcohol dehydrogenase